MAPLASTTAIRTVPVPVNESAPLTVRVPVRALGGGKATPVLWVALKVRRTSVARVSIWPARPSSVVSRTSRRPFSRPDLTLLTTASLVPLLTRTSLLPTLSPVTLSIVKIVIAPNTEPLVTAALGV